MENLKKRTWMFSLPPTDYEIFCDKCKGSNIAWSEFIHRIWCYDCKVDTEGTHGIFDGPIPFETAKLMGLLNKIDLKRKRLVYPVLRNNKIKYYHDPHNLFPEKVKEVSKKIDIKTAY